MNFVKVTYEEGAEWLYLNIEQVVEVQASQEEKKLSVRILYSNGYTRNFSGSRAKAVETFFSCAARELWEPANREP